MNQNNLKKTNLLTELDSIKIFLIKNTLQDKYYTKLILNYLQ
jgi:hypothetical protein